jgi:hypothetical protein
VEHVDAALRPGDLLRRLADRGYSLGCGVAHQRRPDAAATTALQHVERIVSDYLYESAGRSRFRVRLRLYTGWHEGRTRAPRFQGIEKVKRAYASKIRTYHEGHVAFLGGDDGIQIGARLACAPDRLVQKHGVHLLDTLRTLR